MKHAQLIRISGWGMILAALCLLLTFLPDPSFWASAGSLFFLCAILLVTLGLWGLYARYREQIGGGAKAALWAGLLGGGASVVSNILWTSGGENGRTLMNNAMAVMFGGLFVFGLLALQNKPMPRGNGLPALAGFWWPFIVINANVYHQMTGRWPNVTFWPSLALFAGMSLSLALLGYVLQSDVLPKRANVSTILD